MRQAGKRLNVWNDEETNVLLDLLSQEEDHCDFLWEAAGECRGFQALEK